MGKKDLVLKMLGISAVIADCCFWSWRCGQRGSNRCCTSTHCYRPHSHWLESLLGDLKDWHHFHPLSFFLFFPFWETEDQDIQKQLYTHRTLESGHMTPGKDSEKTFKKTKFICEADPQHRDSLQQLKQTNKPK